jgi:hypothetical protein
MEIKCQLDATKVFISDLNIFRAPLCPSSGAQEYYTVIVACGISCCGLQDAQYPASSSGNEWLFSLFEKLRVAISILLCYLLLKTDILQI